MRLILLFKFLFSYHSVVVRIGNSHNFTEQLYRLESEVRQIKNRNP